MNHVKGLLALRSDPLLSDFDHDLDLYAGPDISDSKHYELNIDLVDFDHKRQQPENTAAR